MQAARVRGDASMMGPPVPLITYDGIRDSCLRVLIGHDRVLFWQSVRLKPIVWHLKRKKVGLGYRTALFEMLDAEFQGGYIFDRQLYIGQGVSNKDRGRAGLNSDAYISASLKAEF